MKYVAEFYRDGRREVAHIEDADGWYVCETERCSGESRKKFEQRVASLIEALVSFSALVTTRPSARGEHP